jgi:hypothetical protein
MGRFDNILMIEIANGKPILFKEAHDLSWASAQVLINALSRQYPVTAYVYVGYSHSKQQYKIGKSRNPERRALQLSIEMLHKIPCCTVKEADEIEEMLHRRLQSKRIQGEWFSLSSDDIQKLKQYRVSADVFGLSVHELVNDLK